MAKCECGMTVGQPGRTRGPARGTAALDATLSGRRCALTPAPARPA